MRNIGEWVSGMMDAVSVSVSVPDSFLCFFSGEFEADPTLHCEEDANRPQKSRKGKKGPQLNGNEEKKTLLKRASQYAIVC